MPCRMIENSSPPGIAIECWLFFLYMQGKINKANRKIVAGKGERGFVCVCSGGGGVREFITQTHTHNITHTTQHTGTCLLLAAKFFTDIKRTEIKQLIEVHHITDSSGNYVLVLFFLENCGCISNFFKRADTLRTSSFGITSVLPPHSNTPGSFTLWKAQGIHANLMVILNCCQDNYLM